MIFGPAAYSVSAPSFVKGVFIVGDLLYPQYRVFIAVFAAVMLGGVWLLIDRTNFGAIVKAGMFNSEMVSALGNNLPWLRTTVFIIAAALAGLSGIIAAPIWSIKSGMGTLILMPSFLIVLMGGLGEHPGHDHRRACSSGSPRPSPPSSSPGLSTSSPTCSWEFIIFFRPRGLFGEQNITD